jgi:hypothetical protein
MRLASYQLLYPTIDASGFHAGFLTWRRHTNARRIAAGLFRQSHHLTGVALDTSIRE